MKTLPPQHATAASSRLPQPYLGSRRLRKKLCQAGAYSSGASNLGVLQPLAAPDPQQAALFLQQQQAAAADFSGGGVINVDGPAIASSLLVLLLLLALSFNRILGLERLLGKWLLALQEPRQYERRNEVIQARLTLEQQFAPPAEGGEEDDTGNDGGGHQGQPGRGGTPGSGRP